MAIALHSSTHARGFAGQPGMSVMHDIGDGLGSRPVEIVRAKATPTGSDLNNFISARSFTGVFAPNPHGDSVFNTGFVNDVTVTPGHAEALCVDYFHYNSSGSGTPTPGAGQAQQFAESEGWVHFCGSTKPAGSLDPVTMSWAFQFAAWRVFWAMPILPGTDRYLVIVESRVYQFDDTVVSATYGDQPLVLVDQNFRTDGLGLRNTIWEIGVPVAPSEPPPPIPPGAIAPGEPLTLMRPFPGRLTVGAYRGGRG